MIAVELCVLVLAPILVFVIFAQQNAKNTPQKRRKITGCRGFC